MYWLNRLLLYKRNLILLVVIITANTTIVHAQTGKNDTLLTYAVVYDGDTIEAKTLYNVTMYASIANANQETRARMTRLRNAIIVTFPYAMRSGIILNDMNIRLAGVTEKSKRKEYIKSREKELKKEFTDPLR